MTFSAMQWYQPQKLTPADLTHYEEQQAIVAGLQSELAAIQAQCLVDCKQIVLELQQMLFNHPAREMLFYYGGNITNNTPVKSLLEELATLTESQFIPKAIKSRLEFCCQRYIQNALVYKTDPFNERGLRAHSIVEAGILAGHGLKSDLADFYHRLDQLQAQRDAKETQLIASELALPASRPALVLLRAYQTALKTALEQMESHAKNNHILGIPSLCAKLKGMSADQISPTVLEKEIVQYKTLPQGPLLQDDSPPAALLTELRALINRYEQDKNKVLSSDFDPSSVLEVRPLTPPSPIGPESIAQPTEFKLHAHSPNTSTPISSNFQLQCLFGLGTICTLAATGLVFALALGATATAIPIVATGLGVMGIGMLAFAFFKQCNPSEQPMLDDSRLAPI